MLMMVTFYWLWVVISLSVRFRPLLADHVHIDQMIRLSMGWEPEDDVMTTLVKVESDDDDDDDDDDSAAATISKDGRERNRRSNGGGLGGGGDENTLVGKDLQVNSDAGSQFIENSAGQEVNDGISNWRIVEELKGDEIESGTKNTGKIDQQAEALLSEDSTPWRVKFKRMLSNHRRYRRDGTSKDGETKNMGDCVLNGRSVRMKTDRMVENEREKEIEKQEKDNNMNRRGVPENIGGSSSSSRSKKQVDNNGIIVGAKSSAKSGAGKRSVEKKKGEGQGSSSHVVVMVEAGSEARMACHKCEEGYKGRGARSQETKKTMAEKEGKVSLLWYRLKRVKEKRHYKIQEVSLDMHDDKSRDRVYVTRDHALIFATTKPSDRGSYFCKSPDEGGDVKVKASVPEEEMEDLFKNPKVRFFYHLDVLTPSQEDAILVSPPGSDSGSKPTPSPPVNVTDMNVRVFTDWQEWSPCSVCARLGTRRRVGQCVVTRLNDTQPTSPVFLDAVLSAYGGGVPCKSSLLHGHEKLQEHISKPEEVLQEECNVTCRVHHAQLVMSAFGFLGESGSTEHHLLKQKKFREKEGDHVTLKCQQSSVDKAVAWVNGSNVLIPTHLKKETKGRVWIDEHNTLHIKHAMPWDSAAYVCLIQGQVKGFVRLAVKAKPPDCKVCRYAWYLSYTFPINFVIYLFIVYARHQERKKTLNYELLPVGSSSSGSSSSLGDDPIPG